MRRRKEQNEVPPKDDIDIQTSDEDDGSWTCPKCGELVSATSETCPKCGAVKEQEEPPEDDDKDIDTDDEVTPESSMRRKVLRINAGETVDDLIKDTASEPDEDDDEKKDKDKELGLDEDEDEDDLDKDKEIGLDEDGDEDDDKDDQVDAVPDQERASWLLSQYLDEYDVPDEPGEDDDDEKKDKELGLDEDEDEDDKEKDKELGIGGDDKEVGIGEEEDKPQFKVGELVGYHGREGKVVSVKGDSAIVHFDDTGEDQEVDTDELE